MGSIAIAGSGGTSGLTVGTTTITGGVAGDLLFDNSGVLGEETLSVAIDVIGSAQGDILYRDAAVWKVLAPGAAGNVLQTGGAAANPSWVAGPAAGSISVGVTSIIGGTNLHVLYDNAGLVGEMANFTNNGGNPNVTSGNAYRYNGFNVIRADTANSNYYFAGAGNLTATGTQNFGDGPNTLLALTTGSANSAYGASVLSSITTGGANMAIGSGAMANATTAFDNLAIGVNALGLAICTGSENVALGTDALEQDTSGNSNTAIGSKALQQNTTGGTNVAIGQRALGVNVGGSFNVAIGGSSLNTATGDSNNVAIGVSAMFSNNGGGNNTVIGFEAANPASAISNCVIIGWESGFGLTTGSNNTILGYNESTITSGSQNISLGYQVGVASATASNQLVIGNYIYGTGLSGTGATISTAKIGLGVKAPAQQLDVNGGIQGNDVTALIYAATAMNDGAGTGSGVTFTNAPGASGATGNPKKWVPINDAGTTRYIPTF